MIRASGVYAGRPLLALGLTEADVVRMRGGEPVLISAASLGLPALMVLLVAGATQTAVAADLARRLGRAGDGLQVAAVSVGVAPDAAAQAVAAAERARVVELLYRFALTRHDLDERQAVLSAAEAIEQEGR